MKKLSLIGFVAVTALVVFTAQVQAQTTIANWTFEASAPATAGPFSPEVGAGSALGFHSTTSTYSSPAGNGSSHSFSSNGWSVGDYYQFQVSTLGLTNIGFQWDQTSSTTGPANFQLFWSTDGTTFTSFGAQQTVQVNSNPPNPVWNASTSNSLYTFAYATSIGATVSAINNAATVYFRIQDMTTTSEGGNGGVVAATGTGRVDNVIVTGLANPVYFAGSSLGVGTGGASNVWDNTSSNWSQSVTGSPHIAYTNGTTNLLPAVFQGTAGNVTASNVVSKGGIIFNTTGYSVSGSTINLDTSSNSNGNSISVANGATVTISSQLTGTSGLNKTGLGTLIINPSTTEGFTGGDYTLTQGTLQASTPAQLGNYGSLVLSGGTLQFTSGAGTSFTFDSTPHAVKGTAGGISLPANSTMTINGVVGADTATGPQLTLSGAGSTLNLANVSAPALGGVVFEDAATVKVTNSGTLFLFGNVNDVSSGTSTIDVTGGQIQFAAPASSFNAGPSDATLVIKGDLVSHKAVSYAGAGNIDIQGNNSGWDAGTATIGSSNAVGPTVLVHNSNALGTADATRAFNFNSGELNADAPVTFGVKMSIGAFGSANPAVFSGSDMTFGAAGGVAPVTVFKAATTGAANSIRFEVDNHVTFAGGWGAAVDNTSATGSINGVIVQGTGRLTVNGNASGNILEDLPITTETSVTVEINGKMKKDDSTDWTTLNGVPNFTLGSRSKLKNMASGNVPAASNVIFGLSTSTSQNIYGGTYQNNGTTQSLNTIKVAAAADALQSALSTIDMGGAGSLTFTGGSAGGWTTGATLRVTNWSAGDPLKIGTSAVLSTAEKAAIHFQGYATGSTQAGDGTVTPIGSKIYFLGDADQDVAHHVNAADILPFENALSNLNGYMSSHGFDVATMYDIFDVNGDQQITGADVGAFLNYLKTGHGSNESVPEPSAIILGLLGAGSFAGVAIRRRKVKVAA